MSCRLAAAIIVILGGCCLANAEDDKTKGVEMVPETAVTILKKANAFFAGNLEWTMPAGKDKYKNDYTVNAMGNKVPAATLKKGDSGVR